MTQPRIDTAMRLADGRLRGFAEYGDPQGRPIMPFHGLPGSRLIWRRLPGDPLAPGLRFIAPDRPGYGNSDAEPGPTLLDWADDAAALADRLRIGRFSLLGVSGGGPGASACAWKMPQRLVRVGVVAGAAPTDAPGVLADMSGVNRFFMKLAGARRGCRG